MSIDYHVQQKIYRLETLRRYQAYYGPNTPYQIVAEINQLEAELRRMLEADLTRPAQPINTRSKGKPKAKAKVAPKSKRPPQKSVRAKTVHKKTSAAKPKAKKSGFLGLSKSTIDLIATIAFIGMVFLFGTVIFAVYTQVNRGDQEAALAQVGSVFDIQPTLRPTFTPTVDPNNPNPEPPAEDPPPTGIEVAVIENPDLPSPNKVPTDIPTPVPTLTPSPAPSPSDTPVPSPTDTPVPPPPPPTPVQLEAQPQVPVQAAQTLSQPEPTETPVVPTDTPAPSFRFTVKEQGNRAFQRTNYQAIVIYVAIVTASNVPIGGLKIVGDHSSGIHVESALSDWHWSATNCLDCDYVKFGNVKFEPGTFSDGVWNIYVADDGGNQRSPVVPLSYSSSPDQWVWDFIIFSES
ncbi:MAG: hypothetical protein KDI02_07990 [Anaerolineae bacterium]|nr:hypothetical protein [Anaerolineae bacterium]